MARFLAPLVFLLIAAAVVLIVNSGLSHHSAPNRLPTAAARRLPPYWIVRPGDTLGGIAARTGLSIASLEAYNPSVNPFALTPGERLNLWSHPPEPATGKPKPPGPMFWVVKDGQSFGSIAASTGINISNLEQLNPNLKPASLQPGDRVRLRR